MGLTALSWLPATGWAQAAKAKKAAPVEIEEITVTAQKREENIQEVPISVDRRGAPTERRVESRGLESSGCV